MHHPFENVVEFQPGKTNERVVFSSLTQVFDASPSASSLSVAALDPRERLSHVYFGGEWQTGNTVSFGGPGSQISNLTTLATEWTPGVLFPSCGSVAQRTGHGP
jgi:hypothetical protein